MADQIDEQGRRPHPLRAAGGASIDKWAVGACALYVGVALTFGAGLPFVRFPAFTFPRSAGATAVPLFLADGVPGDIEAYVDFVGIDPQAVDVAHRGVACSVEHRLYEQQHWLRGHGAPAGSPAGPVVVQIGLRILDLDPHGELIEIQRVDATGTAHPRPE
ncbi:MAG: hypothetical protein Q8P18_17485 [Pseudomonadota bacterium]|nr:hypothetical protein [Pseudomonadota bacterium]